MRRIAVVGFVVLLVLAGAVWFAMSRVEAYVQANREALIAQVSAALGREVRVEDLGISLRYGPGVELTRIAVGDDPAFAEDTFAEVDRAVAALKVLPAIRGRYELSRVILERPRIIVIRKPDGFNFESMSQGNGGAGGPPQVQVSDLRILDGRVRFVDRTAAPDAEALVEQIDLWATNVGFDEPMEIELAAAVLGSGLQNVELDGTFGPVGTPERIPQAPLDLNVRLGPLELEGARALPITRDWIPADLVSQGPVTFAAGISGTVSAPALVASLDATATAIEYGQLFSKPAGVRLVVDADLTHAPDAARVDALALHLAGAAVRAEGNVGFGAAVPTDLRVSGYDISLADLAELFPAAADVELSGRVDVDVGGVVTSGMPKLDGSITLRDVRAVQSEGGLDVSGLSMRVEFAGDRIEIPATRFSMAGEPVELSATVASVGEGAVPRLSVRALGGELTGTGSVAYANKESTFELRGRVEGMDVAAILDIVGVSQVQVTGVVEGDLTVRSSMSPP